MGRVVIPGFRKIETSGGGEGGTGNYEDLTNKPSINNVYLVGNLNTVDLKLTDATLTEKGVPAEAKTVGIKMNEKPNYEEGTFSTSLANTSFNPQVKAEYKKVGNIVSIAIKFSFADKIDTAQMGEILGLPFVVSTENATGGFYPMFAKTNNGNYSGMVPFENYMGEVPAVGITDLLGQQTTKVIILYGQYESTN
nr:MAG TPA: hypothetical protein [Caudoviricetes sp.]